MPSNESIVKVQTMYIAYYGRPGDPGGVDFWAGELDAAGGNLNTLIDAFGESQEFVDLYGDLGSEELVAMLFLQVLGREADSEGLQFYIHLLDSGAKSLASIALDIANGVQGSDIDTLDNKLALAQAFTTLIVDAAVVYGEAEIAQAKVLMAMVDSDSASVDLAVATADIATWESDDAPADSNNGSTLSVTTPVTGILDLDRDSDVYAIELEAGVEYYFNLAGLSSGGGTLLDPWLGLGLNSGSEYLAFDDDSGAGLNSLLVFTPDSTAIYYIAAEASGGLGTGTYTLSVDWLGNDTIAADTSTGASLVVGETLSSHLDAAADEDWFAIELTAGIQYRLKLSGLEHGGSSLSDPALALHDEAGTLLVDDDDSGSGLDSLILYVPDVSGTYYLVAANHQGGVGSYSLTAREPFNKTLLTITFEDPNGELDNYRELIETNLQAAWDNWDLYIDAEYDAVLDLVVGPFTQEANADDEFVLAFAGPEMYAGVGYSDDILQGVPDLELSTGADANGTDPDGRIMINTIALEERGYLDFTVNDFTASRWVSFEEVMTHELGHVLGFDGLSFGDYRTHFEALVDSVAAEFTGSYAITANGGPVALDEETLHHLDHETFEGSIMTPFASRGGGDEITDLEIAILADIGLPIHAEYLFS